MEGEGVTTRRPAYRVGADIGGTFTDLVLLGEDGRIARKKVSSTVHDYAEGILVGLREAFAEHGLRPEEAREVVHGTTIATNAILEHKGARTGLIATRGFRDLLEIRRLRMPRLYRLDWKKPPALVERFLRREVTERVASDGTVLTPLDPDEVRAVGRWFVEQGVESLAVVLFNSYANPGHEARAGAVLREAYPDLPVSLSVEILPEIKEYERTSTTVVNAYVLPKVRSYLGSLRAALSAAGVRAPLLIMQSNGGIMSARGAGDSPVRIIESGPAAGVIACRDLGARTGYPNLISFDMGGTTAKASLIENGRIHHAAEYEVGGGVSIGTLLSRGGGYVVRVPSIDIAEVGAGGGSLVWFDKAGGIQVGPQSAGASPGPVCYRQGNPEPTVTDANVTLGYINPTALAGGTLKIDAGAARAAIAERVAGRLGTSLLEAAYGIHAIANANMIRALRSVTTERGRDPREFVLCAFGGSGPIHAAAIARAMEIQTVIVPPCPGLFSAFGLLIAQVEHHYARTFLRKLPEVRPEELAAVLGHMEAEARARADDPEYPLRGLRLRRSLDLRYVGQSTELTVPLAEGRVDPAALRQAESAFHDEYERTYGFRAHGEAIEVVNVRLVAEGARPERPGGDRAAGDPAVGRLERAPRRAAFFGAGRGTHEAPVLARGVLGPVPRPGPLIVEEYDATTVVPPGCLAALDAAGNIVITIGE
jgi:N-methylhydantoinase A